LKYISNSSELIIYIFKIYFFN